MRGGRLNSHGLLGDQLRCRVSEAEFAEAGYTAFTSKKAITAETVADRVAPAVR